MTESKKEKKLKIKQIKFCQEYVKTGNATQSAINAGYKKETAYSYGSELLKNPEIKNYIAKLRKEIEEEFYYSRVDSFRSLEKAQKMALDNIFIKVTNDGDTIEIPKPDLKTFLKAEELKGKLQGLYVEQTKNTTDLNINCMGSVRINDSELTLKIGKEPPKEEE